MKVLSISLLSEKNIYCYILQNYSNIEIQEMHYIFFYYSYTLKKSRNSLVTPNSEKISKYVTRRAEIEHRKDGVDLKNCNNRHGIK